MLGALAALSMGQVQSYASRGTTIRAGVVVLTSDRSPSIRERSSAPFTWLNLDRATSVKPAGWQFDNPNAPGAVSAGIGARWQQITSVTGGVPPVVGDKITRTEAAYWEVHLNDVSDIQISNYDVLLVAPQLNVSLNTAEREKLRKFVDQGGILWVDYGANTNPVDLINNLPIAVRLQTVTGNPVQAADGTSALLSTPFPIQANELAQLNAPYGPSWVLADIRPADLSLPTLNVPVIGDSRNRLQTIARVGADFDSIAMGRIGDGVVVYTARGIAHKLNEIVTVGANGRFVPNPNNGYRAGAAQLSTRGEAAARFAVNLVSLTNTFRQENGGSRKTGSLAGNLSAPVSLQYSTTDGAGSPNPGPNTQPAMSRGVMVVQGANGRLVAYDMEPGRDLDGDGNPDDGIPDYNTGAPYDVLWVSRPLATPCSSPAITNIENPATALRSRDQVLVVERNGSLASFPLLPTNPSTGFLISDASANNLASDFVAPPPNGGSVLVGANMPAPTVHEGIAFVADNATSNGTRGRVWMFDLRLGAYLQSAGRFAIGGNGSRVILPQVAHSPTVGYVPIQDNSGGYDRLLYYPIAPRGTNPNDAAGIASIWVGAKGEKPSEVQYDSGSNRLIVSTRASQQGGLPVFAPGSGSQLSEYAPRLTLIDQAGNPVSDAAMASLFADAPALHLDGGVLAFQLRTGATWPNLDGNPNNDLDVRVDYLIDWGTADAEALTGVIRGSLNFPDTGGQRRVTGAIAMGPDGSLYCNVASSVPGDGGSLWGVKEEGRGIFRCFLRYELAELHNIPLNDGTTSTQEPTIIDVDNVNEYVPSANVADSRLRGWLLRGSPVVRNGQVFIVAQASKFITVPGIGRVPAPVAVLMAFNATPEPAEIPVTNFPAGSVLVQRDFARGSSFSGGVRTATQEVAISNYTFDEQRGVLRVNNLMANDRGAVTAALSLSQPVILRPNSGPDRLIEPDRIGGRWSPLNWYTTINGTTVPDSQNALVVAGSTVYVVGSSVVPSILSTGTLSQIGVLAAYDAEIPSNDPTFRFPALRPWQKQVVQDLAPGIAAFTGNAHVRMPLLQGLNGFSDFVVRLNQTRLVNSTTAAGVVVGEGRLVAWGDGGANTFGRGDVLVCDQNRIGIYDPSGTVQQAFGSILVPGIANDAGSARAVELSRPSRAYRLDNGEILAVNSGNSQIARIDGSGLVRRSIRGFIVDPNQVPDGYEANETTALNDPRDVATWTEIRTRGANDNLTGQQAVEFWIHYLIADTGNRRLIDVVDRYGYEPVTGRVLGQIRVNNVPQLGVLVWHSPAILSGTDFAYNSVNRVFVPGVGATPARYVYVAGIGNVSPSNASVGLDSALGVEDIGGRGGNGGVVILDPLNPRGTQVVRRVTFPDISNSRLWFDRPDGTGAFVTATSLMNPVLISRRGSTPRAMSNVASVTASTRVIGGIPSVQVAVADANGVYEFTVPTSTADTVAANWYLPVDAYRGIRPIFGRNSAQRTEDRNPEGFRPTFARRMANGDMLIVNGYVGRRRNGESFFGEVIQINGSSFDVAAENLGFRISSINYELGPIQGSRGMIQPVFADRR
jgi:hypothetical protein